MRIVTLFTASVLLTPLALPGVAADVPAHHAWAATPPMGWNSWDAFGTALNETQAKAQADVLAEKLLPHGWNIFTVDIQWYEPASLGFEYRKDATLTMDEYGRLLPAVENFPSAANGAGFKPLADYVHAKGLKFGIHVMRGIPRQAVAQNTPILGSDARPADFGKIIALIEAGKVDTTPWITHRASIDDVPSVFESWTKPETGVLKAVIEL